VTKSRKVSVICAVCAVLMLLTAVGMMLWHRYETGKVQDTLLTELEQGEGRYDASSIVLQNTSRSRAQRIADALGAELRITEDGRYAALRLPEGVQFADIAADEAYRAFWRDMSLDYAVSAADAETLSLPAAERPQYSAVDTSYAYQTYLDYVNMKDVWYHATGVNVTVAVIDTGIDTDHPEFAGRLSPYSYNASEDKVVGDYVLPGGGYDWSLIEDPVGHGTAVAGVIASSLDSAGVAGMAPDVNLIVIKAEADAKGNFARTSDLVFGLYYAIERDAHIVNMSFGSYEDENPFAAAVDLAYDSDVICVAAAGNDGTAALCWPAADERVIGVGALEEDGWGIAAYSNYGENVSVMAPGTTFTAALNGAYGTKNGTSLAAPVVTGALALYMEKNPYGTFEEVTEILYASCVDLGTPGCDWDFGYGALDVSALVLEERGTVTFDMMTDELEDTQQLFVRHHSLQDIPVPERTYAVFDGWYYDPMCTEEYAFYEDIFVSDLTLYARWANEDDGIPYTYVTLDDGTVEIRSYTGRRRYIAIPEMIDGRVVSSIGDFAFSEETELREISLPSGLTHIGAYAFENCANLVKMQIPASVTAIDEYAFFGSVRLSSLAFAPGSMLGSIGDYAFGDCGRITRLELPSSVTSVNGTAFLGMRSLREISVSAASSAYISVDGVLFDKTKTVLVAYPMAHGVSYAVPSTVTEIGRYAFGYAALNSVDLGKTERIGENAFAYSALTSVILPDTVFHMDNGAFVFAQDLQSVAVSASLTEIPENAFRGCESLGAVFIPAGVLEIGENAFTDCSSLTSVVFAENSALRIINKGAFAGAALRTVEIPASVLTIESHAFSENHFLASLAFAEGSVLQMIGADAFNGSASLMSVSFPAHLNGIGDRAFAGSGLTSARIPASVTYLGDGAFADCGALGAIDVDAGNAQYASVSGVVYSADGKTVHAYPGGKPDTSYTIAETVTVVAPYAFSGTRHLHTVSLPPALEIISAHAFSGCGAYAYDLPDTLREIGEYAFSGNGNLQRLEIPDGVVTLSRYAFAGCGNLAEIAFSDTAQISRFGFGAFAGSGITSMRIPASVTSIAQGAFGGCSKLYSVTFAADSRLEAISAYMFDGCQSLSSIVFEEGSALRSIQAHGLEGLSSLCSLDLGNAPLENIDNFAFRFCGRLTTLQLPETLTDIGRYAFYACESMSTLSLPSSVLRIGPFAFLGTADLEVYFAAEALPVSLAEDWDRGIGGYYVGVREVLTGEEYRYARLASGGISIIEYLGNAEHVDLTAANLGGDIVSVGQEAFMGSSVKTVVLPETLTGIYARAFAYTQLSSVHIPASVRFIGSEAFMQTSLETLTFGVNAQIETIEQFAFAKTGNLRGVHIPASVKTLGRAVFEESGILSVTFAPGIGLTEIPQRAFASSALQTVAIPDSVTLIDHNAFHQATALREVSFGAAGDVQIMSNAFYHTGLTSLHIPANVSYIGEYAFVGLRDLTEYTVDAANLNYMAQSGLLLTKNGKKLVAVPAGRTGALYVPESVEEIGFGAFEDSALTEVLFMPNANILSVGYRAFYGAKNLVSITLPANIISLDYYAFANCTSLQTVIFESGCRLRGIYEGAFYGCTSLSGLVLPGDVVEISDFAFYGCSSLTQLPLESTDSLRGIYDYAMAYTGLTSFTAPASLIDLGDYAFMGSAVQTVVIPETTAEELIIGIGAFSECRSLTDLTVPFIGRIKDDRDITWLGYLFGAGDHTANATYTPDSLKKVTVLGDTDFIGLGAFFQMASLEEIIVPDTVSEVYGRAFAKTSARYELSGVITPYRYITETWFEIGVDSQVFGTGIAGTLKLIDTPMFIDSGSFSGCRNLEEITLPSGMTEIPNSLFRECTSLRSVEIPYGVTKIGQTAFYRCESLESVTIPATVTSIGQMAFEECTSLLSVVIPDGVREIMYSTFHGCASLHSVTFPANLQSIGHWAFANTALTEVVLPATVTSIDTCAFCGCAQLKNVYIPGTITAESGVFENCTALESAYIGGGNTPGIFRGCTALKHLAIPEGTTAIGNYEYGGLTAVETVHIPASMVDISDSAFSGGATLEHLAAFTVDANNPMYYAVSGILYSKLTNEAVIVPYALKGDITIPAGVTFTETSPLAGKTGITSVVLPEGMTEIPAYYFRGCTSLKSVVLPSTVTIIGYGAFQNCSSLEAVTLPAGVTSIGTDAFNGCTSLSELVLNEGLLTIGGACFDGCSSLKEITIPSTVTQAPAAYDYDSQLEYLYNKSPHVTYGMYQFSASYSIRMIVNADGVPLYRDGAVTVLETDDGFRFEKRTDADTGAVSYTMIDYTGDASTVTLPLTIEGSPYAIKLMRCQNLTSVVIPAGFTEIGDYAFYECWNLVSVTIPEGVTSIGSNAFSGCKALASLTLPQTLQTIGSSAFYESGLVTLTVPSGVSVLGYGTFWGCASLETVALPAGLESIGQNAFIYCSKLHTVNIPNTVTSIGSSAFSGCTSLTSLTLPTALQTIGNTTFTGTALTALHIPAGVTSIGTSVFPASLTALTIDANNTTYYSDSGVVYSKVNGVANKLIYALPSVSGTVIVPEGVTEIASSAFSRRKSLTGIVLPSTLKTIGAYAFSGTGLTSVTVPAGVTDMGEQIFGDCDALITADILAQTTSFGYGMFDSCDKLKTVSIPGVKLNYSGWGAFRYCPSLETVVLSENLTEIPNDTFYECYSLKNVTLPAGVTSIGIGAFRSCRSLETLVLPATLTQIGNGAFLGCSALQSVTIPTGVTKIDGYVFDNCTSLETVVLHDGITSIGDYAFARTAIKEFTVPAGVTEISDYFLSETKTLTAVYLHSGVTVIGERAFYNCNSLATVTGTSGVKEIGGSAFYGTAIEQMDLSNVIVIESYAFSRCSSLTTVILGQNLQMIGGSAFYATALSGDLTIPASVASLGSSAFRDTNLKNVTVLAPITSVPEYCFTDSQYLNTIILPDTVLKIGDYAFYGCSRLHSVKIPPSLTSVGSNAFYYCYSLVDMALPDSVVSIGDNAFGWCTYLTRINLPSTLVVMGTDVFYHCDKLYLVENNSTLPLSIGSADYGRVAQNAKCLIQNGTTVYADGVTSFCYTDTADGLRFMTENGANTLLAYTGISGEVTLPLMWNGAPYAIQLTNDYSIEKITLDGAWTEISASAFREMQSLREVVIPDTVTVIGEYAFYNCYKLTNVQLPPYLTKIGDSAFSFVPLTGDLVLPETLASLGYSAFYSTNITSVTVPAGVTDGYSAFDNCKQLQSATVLCSTVRSSMFSGCSALTSVTLGDGVTEIDTYAFANCTSLASITIPSGVTTLHNWIFANCTSLAYIGVHDGITQIGETTFTDTAYYNNPANWTDGALYIGRHLIRVDEDAVRFRLREDTLCLASGALDGCDRVKIAEVGGAFTTVLSPLTNLETLILWDVDTWVYQYFSWSASDLPITLKNVVLRNTVPLTAWSNLSNPFDGMSGITVYVEAEEDDLRWDENYPEWHGGNTVVYGDKWITADFYHPDGSLRESGIYSTSQVIRIPYMEAERDENFTYEIVGWDLNGDGVADPVPVTSMTDISARPVTNPVARYYSITFLDRDGTTVLYRFMLPYGSAVDAPAAPEKTGYTFVCWSGYADGMKVEEDISFTAEYRHDGDGHVCNEALRIWIDATCTMGGHYRNTCTVCGETIIEMVTPALGHNYVNVGETAPTCTEEGFILYVCSRCEDSYRIHTADPIGHRWGEWTVTTAPGCVTDGIRTRSCTNFGCLHTQTTVAPAVGHTYHSVRVKAPSCEEYGQTRHTCTVCGDTQYTTIAKTAHEYEKVKTSKWWLQILIERILNIFFGFEGEDAYYFRCADCGHVQMQHERASTLTSSVSAMSTCIHTPADTWTTIVAPADGMCGVEGLICTTCESCVEARATAPADVAVKIKGASLNITKSDLADWKGVELYLTNTMAMRMIFVAENIESLQIDVTIDGRTETYTAEDVQEYGNGMYCVCFYNIIADEFDNAVTATFRVNGEQVGRTMTYSVNSYVYSKQADMSVAYLSDLVKAIYNYGAAAYAYVNR